MSRPGDPRPAEHPEEHVMAYSFACASLGAPCPGSFTTEDKAELMEHVALHTAAAHPDLAGKPEMAGALESAIVTV
jgi:predicted small metal-binding protein